MLSLKLIFCVLSKKNERLIILLKRRSFNDKSNLNINIIKHIYFNALKYNPKLESLLLIKNNLQINNL